MAFDLTQSREEAFRYVSASPLRTGFCLPTGLLSSQPAPRKNPRPDVFDLFEQWHRNSEKAIGYLRNISDLVRDCEWRLLGLLANNLTTKAAE